MDARAGWTAAAEGGSLDEIAGENAIRLHEFTKEEWFDVGRLCRPDLTWAAFEMMWAEFWADQSARLRRQLS